MRAHPDVMDVGLVSTGSNPLAQAGPADAPAPMRMSFKDSEPADDRPALQRLCEASGRSEKQLVQMGDEDLLLLMQEHTFLGVAAKNEVLVEITALRNPLPPGAADAGAPDGGDGAAAGRVDQADLNARWEEHGQRLAWKRFPKDTILRWLAIFVFTTFLYSIYADGAYHFQSATAVADHELFDWATAYSQAKLQLHGPTEWSRERMVKTWDHLPAHHAVYLDFRLWAVGGCGMCEGPDPKVVLELDGERIDKTDDGLTFWRKSNYYEGAGSDDQLDRLAAGSAFKYEFSAHAQDLPAPGPKSNSASFAKVRISVPHSASNLTLSVLQSYTGDYYAEQTHGMAMQQVMLDAVRVRYGVCRPPAPQPPLPRLSRRSASQMSADRSIARIVLEQATANCSFEPGQGSGLGDEYIGEADTPEECAELVVQRRPAANGATYSTPDTHVHACWAEFGMSERAVDPGSSKFVSAFFNPVSSFTDDFTGGDARGWKSFRTIDQLSSVAAVSDFFIRRETPALLSHSAVPAEITTCGSFGEILGGVGFGSGSWLQKTYDLRRKPHRFVSVSLQFVKIDSWDGESGVVFADSELVWSKSFSHSAQSGSLQCGSRNAGWHEQAVSVGPLFIAHTADTLTLTATSTLDQEGSDESFGIRDINIRLLGPSHWVASRNGRMKCVANDLLEMPGYLPACCSDQALPGFVRMPEGDRSCPWYMSTDANVPSASTAQRVCAAQGARQCSVVEISSADCLRPPDLGISPEDALLWTEDECERIGQEMECTEDECQLLNYVCDSEDRDALDVVDLIDESRTFSTYGWGIKGEDNGGPKYSEAHASHVCDDSMCSSLAHDCCAPGEEEETCDDGEYTTVLLIGDDDRDDNSGPCVTYTCCMPSTTETRLEYIPSDPAPVSEYSLDYLFDTEDWRQESIAVPLTVALGGSGDNALWWTYIFLSAGLMLSSYFVACKAPPQSCEPLGFYPFIGSPVGRGRHFQLSGGYRRGRLDSTQTRLVLRANEETCATCPGRCGGFHLPAERRALPLALRERGVPEDLWNEHMREQRTLQKRYSRLCDIPMRYSGGCLLAGECPWWWCFKMSWASNCFGCCGCCWRCCCCCECWACCCCNCSTCCCPGVGGFLGLWWHVSVAMICPFVPWSHCDPYQIVMGRWLTNFNEALQPYGVYVKLFTFAQTDAEGGRHADGSTSLSTLVVGFTDEEAKIMQMEPVLQAGHHRDQECPACWALMCHAGRVL